MECVCNEFGCVHRFENLKDRMPTLYVKPMSDIYGMKTGVFGYHPLKTTVSDYLHSTHRDLDNVDVF